MAASGGYYIAVAANPIFIEAESITGSIGVLGGKLHLGGLYQKVGVNKESVERGAHAGWLAEDRSFSPQERDWLRRDLEGFYRNFVERVVDGRELSSEAVEAAAQGRVWSGARALELGLADHLGGPLEALDHVASQLPEIDRRRAAIAVKPEEDRMAALRSLLPGM